MNEDYRRRRLYEIIEINFERDDITSQVYDTAMMVVIILSIIPLAFKTQSPFLTGLDKFALVVFVTDYFFRWITADFRLGKGKVSFVLYPFTGMAILDLLSILPSLTLVSQSLRLFKIVRLVRTMRVIRVFKSFRYSNNLRIIRRVFNKQKDSLIAVGVLAIGYILITSLIIFNIEPDTFPSFFDALYWATISLTTVGYGDIFATSVAGRVITMISALFGIAIVALPAGIITAGYTDEMIQLRMKRQRKNGTDDETDYETDPEAPEEE